MKIAPSLLQTISLALLIPCVASFNDAHGQNAAQKPKIEKDSVQVKPLKKDSLVSIKGKTGQLKPIPKKDPQSCPPCGRG